MVVACNLPAIALLWLPHPVIPVFLRPLGLQFCPQLLGHHPAKSWEEVCPIQFILGDRRESSHQLQQAMDPLLPNHCFAGQHCPVSHYRSKQTHTTGSCPRPTADEELRNRKRSPGPPPDHLQGQFCQSHPPSVTEYSTFHDEDVLIAHLIKHLTQCPAIVARYFVITL